MSERWHRVSFPKKCTSSHENQVYLIVQIETIKTKFHLISVSVVTCAKNYSQHLKRYKSIFCSMIRKRDKSLCVNLAIKILLVQIYSGVTWKMFTRDKREIRRIITTPSARFARKCKKENKIILSIIATKCSHRIFILIFFLSILEWNSVI